MTPRTGGKTMIAELSSKCQVREVPIRKVQGNLLCLVRCILILSLGPWPLALLPGCISRIGGDGTAPDQAADQLRQENLKLQREIETLNHKLDARIKQIETLAPATSRPTLPGVSAADLPRAVALKFARYTGPIDAQRTGHDDTLRLFLRPTDQQDRVIPVTGQAIIQVVHLQPGRPPRVVVETTLSPAELDKDYREGFTGAHYAVDVPLPKDLPAEVTEVTVKAALTDAATGTTLTCEQAMKLKR